MAKYKVVELTASSVKDANGDTHAVAIPVGHYTEAHFFLVVTAKTGTTPTLDVVIENKSPSEQGDYWFTHTAFTQVVTGTTLPFSEIKKLTNIGSIMGIKWTIGGSVGPSWTFSVYAVLKEAV